MEEVQTTRDALTEEVTALGRRNTELEALAKALPILREQAMELKQKNTVLLDLLGEKTEDLEAMQVRTWEPLLLCREATFVGSKNMQRDIRLLYGISSSGTKR